jgi:hypothetical protein
LSGGLLGWHIARQQHAKAFLERLRPPSADQVRKWEGLSENTHLTMFTNVPGDVWYGDDYIHPGKFKWLWAYEDRKGSNFTCVVIAVYESGAFWPSNRAELWRMISDVDQIKKNRPESPNKEDEAFAREMGSMTMPNGQKSYGLLFGLAPARFALHPKFDVLAYVDVEPLSYDDRYPPADLPERGTNSFSEFFTNVDAFLTSQ